MSLEKIKLFGLALIAGAGLAVFGILMVADAALTAIVQLAGFRPRVSLFELVAITPRYWGSSHTRARRQQC